MPSRHAEPAWEPLEPGDAVAVVNCCMAERNPGDRVTQYKKLLEEQWGYRVNGLDDLLKEQGYHLWSGRVEERARRLINAIRNPDNKAIFLLVGGDGGNEVMKFVADWHERENQEGREGLPMRGIPAIGLSNVTTLHNPLAQMGVISPIQGKLDAAVPLRDAGQQTERKGAVIRQNAIRLHNLLSGKTPQLEIDVVPLNLAAIRYRGEEDVEMVGGCNFHVLESARTAFQVNAKGKYLAIEGPEKLFSVKETLEGLEREGMLEGVKAIFLGYIEGYAHRPGETEAQAAKIDAKRREVKKAAEKLSIPVYGGMPWGHIKVGEAEEIFLPLHTQASLQKTDGGAVTLQVDAFRSRQNLEEAHAGMRIPVINQGVPVESNPVIVSIERMLQSTSFPDIRGKHVIMAVTPKSADPMSHMLEVARGLAALLHKGNLQGVESLTVDLAGLGGTGNEISYHHTFDPTEEFNEPYYGHPIRDAIRDREGYRKALEDYLREFSEQHLGGIKTAVGDDVIIGRIAVHTATPADDLKEKYAMRDGTDRYNASRMADDYDNGKSRLLPGRREGERSAGAAR